MAQIHKEKAQEVVEKFSKYSYTKRRDAKQCAIICCDEIIAETNKQRTAFALDRLAYWQSVKEEIEKL